MGSTSGESSCQKDGLSSLYLEILHSDSFGRYLVAKEDIPEKTLILSEIPVVFGPTDDKNLKTNVVSLYCVACCKFLYPLPNHHKNGVPQEEILNRLWYCSTCGFPVCDKQCEKSAIHSENECKFISAIYQQKMYPPPCLWLMYKSVILLRILLLIKNEPESVWGNFFEKLEHHSECRETKEHCVRADEIVLENLDYFTQGLTTKKRSVSKKNGRKYKLPFVDDQTILKRIIGALNVNSFCANNNVTGRIARCMFRTASLFAHSCAPNCCWSVEMSSMESTSPSYPSGNGKPKKNGKSSRQAPKVIPEMQVYTAVAVKKGEILTIPYSTRHIFCGTLKRQINMEGVGHFICKCRRCLDPTELGTFMSSIRCFKCDSGFLVPVDPSDQDSKWVCVKTNDKETCCGYKCSVGKVFYFVTNIQDSIDRFRGEDLHWIEEQERLQILFDKYRGHELHDNHYLVLEISTDIVEILAEKLFALNDEHDKEEYKKVNEKERVQLVDRFLFHVRVLMSVADVILPGFNNNQEQLQSYLDEGESLKRKM